MEFGTPRNLSTVSEKKDGDEASEENLSYPVIKIAEKHFIKGDFEKAALFLESADDEFVEARIEELLNGDDSDRELAEKMYQSTEWKDETGKADGDMETKEGNAIRVVMPEGKNNDGKVLFLKPDEFTEFMKEREENKLRIGIGENGELIFETKQPEIVLERAEKCFNAGDLEGAYFKLRFISEKDKEKRIKELSNGSDEERDLAEKMYLSAEWQDEIRNDTWEKKLEDRRKSDKN